MKERRVIERPYELLIMAVLALSLVGCTPSAAARGNIQSSTHVQATYTIQ